LRAGHPLHINPHIGGLRLDQLTALHVEQLFVTHQRRGVSARNEQLAGIVLNGACRSAVRLKLLAHNPCADVTKPRAAKYESQTWDTEQSRCFLEAAKADRLFALY